jgi:MFS transporter, DHA1 family, tetracycline resistance protein
VLFTTYRFGWTEAQNGLSLALVGLMFGLVQGGLAGKFVAKFGERRALLFGLSVGALGFLLYGLATQGWMLYAIIAATSIGGVAGPALMSMITRLVPASEQGALQGALSSVQSLAAIAGPLMATSLFGYFTSPHAPVHLPGAAFLVSAILVALGVLLAARSAQVSEEPKMAEKGDVATV